MAESAGLGEATPIGLLPSTDLDRASRFFGDTLGLDILEMTPFACVARVGSTMLRVTKVDSFQPHPFTVFGWRVPDIRGVMARLVAAGVEFVVFDGLGQDDDGVWAAPSGDLVAWFRDPDGNLLSLTQFAD